MNPDLFLEKQKEENKGSHEGMKMQERIAPEILKIIPATLNVVDTDYNILAIGGNISRISKSTEKIIGKKCHKVFQKRDKPCPWCKIGQVIMTGEVLNEMTAPDDPREKLVGKPLNVYVCPLKGKDGDIIGVLELATDITRIRKADEERKQAEEALRQSEEKYHSLYDTMKEGVAIHKVVYDTSGEAKDYMILDVNPSYEKILSLKKEKAVGRKASELYGTGQPPYIEIYAKVAASGQPTSFETYFLAMDKHFRISVFSPGHGQFATVFTDISERKRAEEKLSNSLQHAQYLADIVRHASVGIGDGYPDGNVGLCNKAFQQLTGYSEEELKRISWTELLTPREWRKYEIAKLEELHRTKKPVLYEKEYIRKDGSRVPAELVVHPRLGDDGNVESYFAFITDITQRKQAQEALRNAHDKLEERVEERTAQLLQSKEQLEEVNTALRVLLKRREEDKSELEEKILYNVRDLVLPYLEKLNNTSLNANQKVYIDILESNLQDLTSPFSHRLSVKHLRLTPTQIQVANLVKDGKATKEIAQLMHLSPRTVECHRNNIRKRLGLKNTKANLRTYLSSVQ